MIPPLSVLTVRSCSTLVNMSSFLRFRLRGLSYFAVGDEGLLEKDDFWDDGTVRRRIPLPAPWVGDEYAFGLI